jgi:hypothetical protein
MTAKPALREITTPPDRQRRFWRSASVYRAGALFCVLLVFLTSFIAVAHFHANDSAVPDHACSLCALAHAGVAVNSVAAPAPVFSPTVLTELPATTPHSLLFVSSHYIRPPPQV